MAKAQKNFSKYVGCLLGGAAGDALGFAVEFYDEDRIFGNYGENGITEYACSAGIAHISDDTQMTLFTAEGLLQAHGENAPFAEYPIYLHAAYKNWLTTQQEIMPVFDTNGSRLLGLLPLYADRAPGGTCLGALLSGRRGSVANAINDSKGCGGVMRVAPIALYCQGKVSADEADKLGAEAAAITHGHKLGYIPAAALTRILSRLLEGDGVQKATEEAIEATKKNFPCAETEALEVLLKKAISLAGEDLDDLEAIHALGEGWVAEETLAIAVYCALKYENDLEKCLIAAVNHKGDSDSTGAVAGNILGARLGAEGIPVKFVKDLELYDTLVTFATDLYFTE